MIKDKLIVIRSILFATLMGFFYVMAFHSLFMQSNILVAVMFFLLLFIVFHFFFVEIYRYPIRYFGLSLAILSVIWVLLGGVPSLQMSISVVILHLGIFILGRHLKDSLDNKVSFNSFSYFTSGGYIFTVFITIGVGLATMGLYTKFPFSCDMLSEKTNSVVDAATKPFKLGIDQATKIKTQAELFFGFKISDVMHLEKAANTAESGPISWLSTELIKQVQEEQVSTSTGMCDYLMGKVNEKFGIPEYRVSMTLLLFLLFYPFIRLVFWIMSLIAFAVFKVLYWTHVYHIEKEKETIEKIG